MRVPGNKSGRDRDPPRACGGGGDRGRAQGDHAMTARKHFKQLVRDRMRQTGERYTVARRHVEASAPVPGSCAAASRRDGGVRERARQPRRRARGRAAVRGDGAGRRRRARRGLHPVGVRRVRLPRAHARVPAPVAVPGAVGGGDRRAARPARRAARDGRREGRGRGARRAARPRPAGDRWIDPYRSATAGCRRAATGRRPAGRRLRARRRRVPDRRPLAGARWSPPRRWRRRGRAWSPTSTG